MVALFRLADAGSLNPIPPSDQTDLLMAGSRHMVLPEQTREGDCQKDDEGYVTKLDDEGYSSEDPKYCSKIISRVCDRGDQQVEHTAANDLKGG